MHVDKWSLPQLVLEIDSHFRESCASHHYRVVNVTPLDHVLLFCSVLGHVSVFFPSSLFANTGKQASRGPPVLMLLTLLNLYRYINAQTITLSILFELSASVLFARQGL